MNNTKRTLTAISAIILMAATLVVGTAGTATTKMAFAASNNNSGNTVTALAAQNRGFASGFDTKVNQEAQNTICTHPSENAACTQEGAAVPTAVKKTCEQCFTKFLTPKELQVLLFAFDVRVRDLTDMCAQLQSGQLDPGDVISVLRKIGVDQPRLNDLIACLKDAGIVFV
jgi:hypothetical protein